MLAATIFGIAAAVFVFSTTLSVLAGFKPDDPLGWTRFNMAVWLLVVAASAGTMYAVASGVLP